MVGLLPDKKTKAQILAANDALLKKHEAYFQAWVKAQQGERRCLTLNSGS